MIAGCGPVSQQIVMSGKLKQLLQRWGWFWWWFYIKGKRSWAGGRHGSPVLSPTMSLDRPSASLQRMYSMDLPTVPVGPTVVQHPPGNLFCKIVIMIVIPCIFFSFTLNCSFSQVHARNSTGDLIQLVFRRDVTKSWQLANFSDWKRQHFCAISDAAKTPVWGEFNEVQS